MRRRVKALANTGRLILKPEDDPRARKLFSKASDADKVLIGQIVSRLELVIAESDLGIKDLSVEEEEEDDNSNAFGDDDEEGKKKVTKSTTLQLAELCRVASDDLGEMIGIKPEPSKDAMMMKDGKKDATMDKAMEDKDKAGSEKKADDNDDPFGDG